MQLLYGLRCLFLHRYSYGVRDDYVTHGDVYVTHPKSNKTTNHPPATLCVAELDE